MIKEHVIEKLISLNIQDVVADYVTLKKSGVNYKGLCPFHEDKNPSFYVSPTKNICHCFVCGKGGNPISFVMEKENCDFHTACKMLGEKYHIQVEEEDKREPTKEERELQAKREDQSQESGRTKLIDRLSKEFSRDQLRAIISELQVATPDRVLISQWKANHWIEVIDKNQYRKLI